MYISCLNLLVCKNIYNFAIPKLELKEFIVNNKVSNKGYCNLSFDTNAWFRVNFVSIFFISPIAYFTLYISEFICKMKTTRQFQIFIWISSVRRMWYKIDRWMHDFHKNSRKVCDSCLRILTCYCCSSPISTIRLSKAKGSWSPDSGLSI